MYGYFLDPTATAYLARIAQSSREWATAALMTELNKVNDLRVWHHSVLEELAWADHPGTCRCPLERVTDAEIRVRAASRAIRRYVDATATSQAIDPWIWIRGQSAAATAKTLERTLLLEDCLEEVKREAEAELRQRRQPQAVCTNHSGGTFGNRATGLLILGATSLIRSPMRPLAPSRGPHQQTAGRLCPVECAFIAEVVLRVRLTGGERMDITYEEPTTDNVDEVIKHVISTLSDDSGVLQTRHGDRLVVLYGRGVAAVEVAPRGAVL